MPSKYQYMLQNVVQSIQDFRKNLASIQELQAVLYSAAITISLPEERSLSNILEDTAEQLEMIQFTVEPEDVYEEAVNVAKELEETIKKAML